MKLPKIEDVHLNKCTRRILESIGGSVGSVDTRGVLQYAKELVKSGYVLCVEKNKDTVG